MSGIRITEFALEVFTADTLLTKNNSCTLFIQGTSTTNYMPLYTEGNAPSSGYMPLFVEGSLPNSGQFPLYICGHIPGSGYTTLYTLATGPSSGYIPLFIEGHLPNSGNIPLYIDGHIPVSSGVPLVCWNVPVTGVMPLYIGALGDRIDGSAPLYLYNSAGISGANLVIWGKSYSSGPNPGVGWYSTPGQMFLYIEGQGKSNYVPLYLNAVTGVNNNTAPLYISSLIPAPSGSPLYTRGTDTKTNNPKLYTHGF